jgi:molecular chaperone HscA
VVVKPSFGLAETDILQMIQASQQHALDDKNQRSWLENKVEAERHLEALQAALAQDGDQLLSQVERAQLLAAMQELEQAMQGSDSQLLANLTEQLNSLSRDYAGRRMDQGIRQALAGKTLEAVEVK